ncbi:MAG: GNAT family N-acetyltransferase [Bacilli bacterium]|nr:GNAT family N-acetyltransferase [Bacilli bacterium]
MNAVFAINGKVIETDRLILRAFNQNDLRDFFEYARVPGVGEMAGWKHHENEEISKEILNIFINGDKTFALVDKKTNKVIGSLGVEEYGLEDKLTEFDGYKGRELGFVLSKDYWGKGLMAEACLGVMDYLFNELEYDFLICGHFNKNNQSKRVQEKLGFKPYRKMTFDTRTGTKEEGVLNLLINPKKNIKFNFSHPETLIWEE